MNVSYYYTTRYTAVVEVEAENAHAATQIVQHRWDESGDDEEFFSFVENDGYADEFTIGDPKEVTP